jgi:ankyrin repeat protein
MYSILYLKDHKERLEIVNLLLSKNVNLHIKSCSNKTALDFAIENNEEDVVELIKNKIIKDEK